MIKDLHDFLIASAAVSNLLAKQKIERQYARQGTEFPYLVMSEIDDSPPLYTLSGEPDLSNLTVQIDAWARDEDTPNGALRAKQLADAVRNRLSGYRGLIGDSFVSSCTMTRSTPFSEEPEDGSDRRPHRVSMDFDIKYQRAVPDLT